MGRSKSSLFHTSQLGLNHQTMKYQRRCRLWSSFGILVLVIVLGSMPNCDAKALLSKSILCADAKCESLYGKGQTLTRYPSPDKDGRILSFKKDVPVKIFGKTEDKQYLFVEINNSRGFVPAQHIQENAIVTPDLAFKVDLSTSGQPNASLEPPTDSSGSVETPILSPASSSINDQPSLTVASSSSASFVYTSKSATVIEGTTFYEDVLKTNTPSPTYPADVAASKTATIEANFADEELNQQTVVMTGGGVDHKDEEGVVVEDEQSSKEVIVDGQKASPVDDVAPPTENLDHQDPASTKTHAEVDPKENEVQVDDVPKESEPIEAVDDVSQPEEPLLVAVPEPESEVMPTLGNQSASESQAPDTVATQSVEPQSEAELPATEEKVEAQPEPEPVEAAVENEEPENNQDSLVQQNETHEETPAVVEETQPEVVQEESAPIETPTVNSSVESPPSVAVDDNQTQQVDPVNNSESLLPQPQSPPLEEQPLQRIVEEELLVASLGSVEAKQLPEQSPLPVIPETEERPPVDTPHAVDDSPPVDSQQPEAAVPVESFQEQPADHQYVPPIPTTLPPPLPRIARGRLFGSTGSLGGGGGGRGGLGEEHVHQPNAQPEISQTPPPPPPASDFQHVPHYHHAHLHEQQPPPPPPPIVDHGIPPPAAQPDSWTQPPPPPPPAFPAQPPHQPDSVPPSQPIISNQPSNSAVESFPASDALDDHQYGNENASGNGSRRRLLAEKIGFVGVVMNVIPDELELFIETFNPSAHVVVFTSLIAAFWCAAKVVIAVMRSSKKERDLRDINCQVQRKIYYFEAEKEKLREEARLAQEKLSNYERERYDGDRRKSKMETDYENLKMDCLKFKSESEQLRLKLNEAEGRLSKYSNADQDLDRARHERRQLEMRVEDMEETVKELKDRLRAAEEKTKADEHEIKSLTKKLGELTQEKAELEEGLAASEQNFQVIQSENQGLKATQAELNEEMRNQKDELLSLTESLRLKDEESATRLKQLEATRTDVEQLKLELEARDTELTSMQSLLNKLNKNISKSSSDAAAAAAARRRASSDVNGNDLLDSTIASATVNGDSAGLETESLQTSSSDPSDGQEDPDLQNIVQLQLRVSNLELEKRTVESQREKLQKELTKIGEKLQKIQSINDELRAETETARAERLKAITELEVLSKYYKEKELEYGKEIGFQRVKREEKEEDATSASENLRVAQEECDSLRAQLKSLKKELDESERRYKTQLNALEKQAHENWIAARNAERKYDESKAEATALRQTLSLSASNVRSPPPSDLSLSGFLDDSASSVSDTGPFGQFNSSLPGLPPPPPPPPPPMMLPASFMAGLGIPPPPPPPQAPTGGAFFDENANVAAAAAAAYWNATATTGTGATDPNSIYVQSSGTAYQQMPQQQQQQHQQPYQQYGATPTQQQHHQQHQQQQQQTPQAQTYAQWEDQLNRSYSPALSQRSHRSTTATPLTNPLNQQQQQPHQQQQQAYSMYNVPTTVEGAQNPYSIASYQQSPQQQYSQQHQDPNGSYGNLQQQQSAAATLNATQTHQGWSQQPPQQQQQQQDPYAAYAQYGAQPNQQQQQQQSAPNSGSSRPASVHTQMV